MGLLLSRPSIQYKQQVLEYKNEFIEDGDDLAGTSYLEEYDNYEEWMRFVFDNEKENTKHTEVTASVFLAIRENDNKLVGMINIRHTLNEYLYNYGGHIGYSVRRTERRKGYATEMLKIALKKCRKLKMKKVLLTCDVNNIASAKTIKTCGGVLENEVPNDGRLVQRYWII
ncbi:GNAT family N-acetyltransferase [Clostridium guangxiense]|uniref:GNAT family N-acetyltransferase n=1 Tax=Clostridium guangxiense TaxID=1662055 RepID=UPI001E4AD23C|nr:GNAT family N-acetyltransferase [Clostridium guangxiense]MCD2348696.1 GNAT family N-acetyltransferase [Clostridium guangxiense]